MEKVKAKGIARLKLNGIMEPFNLYGLGDEIPGAIEQILALCEWYHDALNGNEYPLRLESRLSGE